jgi:hypothetical protein
MCTWFEELSRNRREWVNATRRNNFEAGIRGSTVDKYADPAHFLYELLQNAEDQEATWVRFVLEPDRLVFTHGGKPFCRRDVELITGIGNSDKPFQANKIGRFGLGFKSVFAVSDRPEVYSWLDADPFAFAIEDLVVPVPLAPDPGLAGGETRFVFPFKPGDVQSVHQVILDKLSSLGADVLLFLNHIAKVYWETAGAAGEYACDRTDPSLRVLRDEARTAAGTQAREARFRVYSRDVTVADAERPLSVRLAFRLNDQGQVVPEERATKLSVYFETEEMTGLHFRVHGPFLLTDNRANIKQKNKLNGALIRECTGLVLDALHDLREQSLLTATALAALPNQDDDLPAYCEPIREAVLVAVREQPLIPTQDGGYGRATELAQGPQPIRELLDGEALSFLTGGSIVGWAAGVMRNSRSEHFLRAAGIQTWGLAELAEAAGERFSGWSTRREDQAWLSARPDGWLQHFYALLLKAVQEAEVPDWTLRHWQIVRLEDGTHVKGEGAYFPPEKGKGFLDLRRVKAEILAGKNQARKDNARKFLAELGVKEIGEREELEAIIKKHYSAAGTAPNAATHLRHMRRFVEWWSRHHDSEPFQHAFLFLDDCQGTLHRPSSCLLDEPYCDSGLRAIHSLGIPGLAKRPLWDGYQELASKGFVKFATALGVQAQLRIVSTRVPQTHPRYRDLHVDWLRSRARLTDSSIDIDYDIPYSSELLARQDPEISRRVWKTMTEAPAEVLQARFRPNQQYRVREALSSLVLKLRDTAWIPDRSGVFRRPRDMSRADLAPEFPFKDSSGWLSAIDFGEAERQRSERYRRRQEMARELGLPLEFLDRLDELDQASRESVVERFTDLLDRELEPEFPERRSSNPTRRAAKLRERLTSSPPKTREVKPRTVRTSEPANRQDARAYLRDLYTNADGVMICQACHQAMPFRLDNGEYYFEAVELFTDVAREYRENHLALCPTCAAMFTHASATEPQELRESLEATSDLRVPVTLARELGQIRFVEDHRTDLLAIIDVEFQAAVEG